MYAKLRTIKIYWNQDVDHLFLPQVKKYKYTCLGLHAQKQRRLVGFFLNFFNHFFSILRAYETLKQNLVKFKYTLNSLTEKLSHFDHIKCHKRYESLTF